MKTKQLYQGQYNWQNEIHKMWTRARNPAVAHRNFIAKLTKLLGISGYRLRCYFNEYKDNFKIKEVRIMKNKGLNQRRYKQNPLEKRFAKSWDEINTDHHGNLNGRGILDYLMAKHINNPQGEISDRDRIVAATAIQWLGSAVGQSFLIQIK